LLIRDRDTQYLSKIKYEIQQMGRKGVGVVIKIKQRRNESFFPVVLVLFFISFSEEETYPIRFSKY
jgi:hypothetical protein